MTPDRFWDLIRQSRDARAGGCQAQAAALGALLDTLPTDEVVAFNRELTARLAEAYRWDLWAAGYVINGGCSDDGFVYFRLWLVGRGREYFEAALRDPERAGDAAAFGEAECEDLLYPAAEVYMARTGADLPRADEPDSVREPAGERWTGEDLPRLVPGLLARFA